MMIALVRRTALRSRPVVIWLFTSAVGLLSVGNVRRRVRWLGVQDDLDGDDVRLIAYFVVGGDSIVDVALYGVLSFQGQVYSVYVTDIAVWTVVGGVLVFAVVHVVPGDVG
jgi:hypothetical protein